jgi:RimJ/RimL family protein N-acetyltransferase
MNNGSFDLDNVVIEGHHVRLEPYTDALREPVRAALDCDAEGWHLFAINGQGADFDGWWDILNAQVAYGDWIAYAIRQRATDAIVGTTSFLNIKRSRQCVEIGATFLHPDVRSTLVNAEAKYLMLQHAFACGARRVELLTDARNLRSQAAIAKLGAVREGVLRRERVTWTGYVRDSVLFAVTDLDWPDVRGRLQERLGGGREPVARPA